jgi:hypothetical protein
VNRAGWAVFGLQAVGVTVVNNSEALVNLRGSTGLAVGNEEKWYQEGVKKSPSPVILSEAKNLHLFVFKKVKADSSLRSE